MFEVKERLTPEAILDKIDQYLIFKYYCPSFKEVDKHFHSELRKDPNPSAVITYYNNRLWYKDFGSIHKGVDCFGYVMLKYNVNFLQALGIINMDFNLGLNNPIKIEPSLNLLGFPDKVPDYKEKAITDIILQPIFRNWMIQDKEYWYKKYGITKKLLEFYLVRPVVGFNLIYLASNKTLKKTTISKNTITYSYLLAKKFNGIDRYKIYSPLEEKYKKWLSNCSEEILQGFDQLDLHGEDCVITKSLKDVMVLRTFGINSFSPQSENAGIDEKIIINIKKRYNNILLLYDFDNGGILGATKLSEKYSIRKDFIPVQYIGEAKDISDFREKFGKTKTKELLVDYFKLSIK